MFGDSADGDACRRERLDIESFLDPFAAEPAGWLGELRRGLRSDPLGAAQRLDRIDVAQGAVAAGLLHLATGHVDEARRSFDRALLHDRAPSWTLAAARLGGALCDVARDGVTAEVIEEIDFLADTLDSEWLARLARIVVSVVDRRGGVDRVRQIADRCELDGDPWGRMLCLLSTGISRARGRRAGRRRVGTHGRHRPAARRDVDRVDRADRALDRRPRPHADRG